MLQWWKYTELARMFLQIVTVKYNVLWIKIHKENQSQYLDSE